MKQRVFHPETVKRILVIRLYFIGDMLLSTPALAALRDTFPHASITVLLKKRARDVLVGNPDVDELIIYDAVPRYHSPAWTWRLGALLRRRRFDLAVDLTGDLRSSWALFVADPGYRVGVNRVGLGRLLDRRVPYRSEGHVVDHLLDAVGLAGAKTERTEPRMYLSDAEREAARSLSGDEPYLAMAPGAQSPLRRWPAERYGELAARARRDRGMRTLFTGTASDAPLCVEAERRSEGAGTSLAGRTGDLRVLGALFEGARAYVGSDSGPLHIAAAVGTPVVGLFGPNTPNRFAPRGAPSRLVVRTPPCSPCAQDRCMGETGPCLRTIGVDEVAHALSSLLEDTEGPL